MTHTNFTDVEIEMMLTWMDSTEYIPTMSLLNASRLLVAHLQMLKISPPHVTRSMEGVRKFIRGQKIKRGEDQGMLIENSNTHVMVNFLPKHFKY